MFTVLSLLDFLNFTSLKESGPNLSESVSLFLLLLLANFLHCLLVSECKKGTVIAPSEAYRFESESGECFVLEGEEEDEEEVSESEKFLQGLFQPRPESPNI